MDEFLSHVGGKWERERDLYGFSVDEYVMFGIHKNYRMMYVWDQQNSETVLNTRNKSHMRLLSPTCHDPSDVACVWSSCEITGGVVLRWTQSILSSFLQYLSTLAWNHRQGVTFDDNRSAAVITFLMTFVPMKTFLMTTLAMKMLLMTPFGGKKKVMKALAMTSVAMKTFLMTSVAMKTFLMNCLAIKKFLITSFVIETFLRTFIEMKKF